MSELRAVSGALFDIQRFSIHDGPGIRTTVFLKGCPLQCRWCHNPEGIPPEPQLSCLPEKCLGCGHCAEVCPQGAHDMGPDDHHIDRSQCLVCSRCAEACDAQALEVIGRTATAGETIDEVLRDLPFYETSGGGMTLSGGEPTYQPEFAEALLRHAKEEGLHCCVETSGYTAYKRLDTLRPHTGLFLYDLKETDEARHLEYTGVSVKPILDNLRRLHDTGAAILLRCPIIPGLNDRQDHFEAIATLAQQHSNLQGVELMPYHPLGQSKRERLGMPDPGRVPAKAPTRDTVSAWCETLRSQGVAVVNEV